MSEQLELFKGVEKEIKKITKKRKKRFDSKAPDGEYELLEFKRIINQQPPEKFLQVNEHYKNKYIPLQILEMMLRAIYISYEVEMVKDPVITHENIFFFVNVIVKNPVTKDKEIFTGASAIPLMPKDGVITDLHPRIPAGVSFAIMNACKHIGRLFRADNDDVTKVFDSYFEKKKKVKKKNPLIEKKEELKKRLLEMIMVSTTVESLAKKEKDVKKLAMKEVTDAYYDKERVLKDIEKKE